MYMYAKMYTKYYVQKSEIINNKNPEIIHLNLLTLE